MGTCLETFHKIKKHGGKKDKENQDVEGFTRVPNKKISTKKSTGPEIHKKVQTQNMFEALQEANISNNQQEDQVKDKQGPVKEPNLKIQA